MIHIKKKKLKKMYAAIRKHVPCLILTLYIKRNVVESCHM